jgi:hypothetical protein
VVTADTPVLERGTREEVEMRGREAKSQKGGEREI